eukprot:scaffold7381_cov310-Pinguiococcus_pyrenoidosus.AAC.16
MKCGRAQVNSEADGKRARQFGTVFGAAPPHRRSAQDKRGSPMRTFHHRRTRMRLPRTYLFKLSSSACARRLRPRPLSARQSGGVELSFRVGVVQPGFTGSFEVVECSILAYGGAGAGDRAFDWVLRIWMVAIGCGRVPATSSIGRPLRAQISETVLRDNNSIMRPSMMLFARHHKGA